MRKNQIASFVTDILNAGATLLATDDDSYFFGDLVVADDKSTEAWSKINDICQRYGPRDHLRCEIATHLKYLGKVINLDGETDVPRRMSHLMASIADPTDRGQVVSWAEAHLRLYGEPSSRLH